MKLTLRKTHKSPAQPQPSDECSLADFSTNARVRIRRFGNLPPATLHHLRAYGVLPGREIRILAQRPLVIIQVEESELALEESIARQVFAEAVRHPV